MRSIILLICLAFSIGMQAQTEQTNDTGVARPHSVNKRAHAPRQPRHGYGQKEKATKYAGEKALLESKSYDNWYIGINGGGAVKTSHNKWMKNLNGNAGVRVGRWFTPAFGLALESNAYFSSKPWMSTGTVVQYLNTDLAATINISNWWFGYNGEPRLFEVIAVPAIGMGHVFGISDRTAHNLNDMTGKLALDFAFNVDKKKCLQLYLEPAMLYSVYSNTSSEYTKTGLNINRSHFQLNVGLVYKFKNTNGTHNFRYAEPKVIVDNEEIHRLNRRIADLEEENERLRNKPEKRLEPRIIERTETVYEGVVAFSQGSSYVEKLQYTTINKIAAYMNEHDARVTLTGYSSTEGTDDLNQKLSEARAESVKHALITKFGIDASRIDIVGAGATDKYSDELDYNRVVVFEFSE